MSIIRIDVIIRVHYYNIITKTYAHVQIIIITITIIVMYPIPIFIHEYSYSCNIHWSTTIRNGHTRITSFGRFLGQRTSPEHNRFP